MLPVAEGTGQLVSRAVGAGEGYVLTGLLERLSHLDFGEERGGALALTRWVWSGGVAGRIGLGSGRVLGNYSSRSFKSIVEPIHDESCEEC